MRELDIIQKADTNIGAGTDLYEHQYNFKEVVAIIKQCKKEFKEEIEPMKQTISNVIEDLDKVTD